MSAAIVFFCVVSVHSLSMYLRASVCEACARSGETKTNETLILVLQNLTAPSYMIDP